MVKVEYTILMDVREEQVDLIATLLIDLLRQFGAAVSMRIIENDSGATGEKGTRVG